MIAEVLRVYPAFGPELIRALRQLPGVKARAELGGYGLRNLCPLIMAQAVVCKAQGLRQHPALTAMLGQKGLDASITVTTTRRDTRLQISERNQAQHRLA